jgi:hypothetical protein
VQPILGKCDPQNEPVEKKRLKCPLLRRGLCLYALFKQSRYQFVAVFWDFSGLFGEVGREQEKPRLGGCAGSPRPTRLSLQIWEMQGDSAKLHGERGLVAAESLSISTRWIALSLT